MYKVPVFLSLTQLEDTTGELYRQINHLKRHIASQSKQHGDDCCDGERDWMNSLQSALDTLSVARDAFYMVEAEPKPAENKSPIIEQAQTRINATMKRSNWGLPGNGGGYS